MEMTIRMPDRYNVMSEEEMTYTSGGAAAEVIGIAKMVASTVVGIYGLYTTAWGIINARNWLAVNKSGDLMTTLDKAVDDGVAYATANIGNLIQSCVALMGMTAIWPVTAIALITA